jgi:hypothetical protein
MCLLAAHRPWEQVPSHRGSADGGCLGAFDDIGCPTIIGSARNGLALVVAVAAGPKNGA